MRSATFLLLALLASCVLNENGEGDYPPPCNTAVMDISGLKRVCEQVEMTQGN